MSKNETAEAIFIVLRKVGKWLLIVFLAILFVLVCFFSYEYVRNIYDNRLKVVTEIDGIKLGDKFSDFMFKNAGFKATSKKDKSKVRADDYSNENSSFDVNVTDNKISMITYICKDYGNYVQINGISCKDSGDVVLNKYDKEIRVLCLKNREEERFNSYRIYDAVKYGVRHHVVSNSVLGMTVLSTSQFNDKILEDWGDCD